MTSTRRPGSAGAIAMLAVAIGIAAAGGSRAQDIPPPDRKIQYSPYPEKTFPNRVYFGDTHLHTSYSADAGMAGARLGPEEAYRFARGEEVVSNTGQKVRLRRPLDFLVIADHAENLGLAPMIARSDPALLTPRWTTYDAKVFGVKLRTDLPASIQERAYTSPIWYTPA